MTFMIGASGVYDLPAVVGPLTSRCLNAADGCLRALVGNLTRRVRYFRLTDIEYVTRFMTSDVLGVSMIPGSCYLDGVASSFITWR